MNNLKKWILLLVIPVAATSIAKAQTLEQAPTYSSGTGTGKMKINLFYNYSLPLGTFKNDLIKNNSPRGCRIVRCAIRLRHRFQCHARCRQGNGPAEVRPRHCARL